MHDHAWRRSLWSHHRHLGAPRPASQRRRLPSRVLHSHQRQPARGSAPWLTHLQDLTAAGVSIWLDEIPATQAGLPAIAQCLADGISINVTLIFSLQRYAAVIEAYLDGMEPALAAGRNLSTLTFVGSFFVSRVDTEIDKRLDQMATTKARAPKGKAATANSRLAYKHYERVFAGERRGALLAAGAQPQPLRASTGVKDLSYDDTRYVVDLVSRALSTRCRRRPWGRTQHQPRPPRSRGTPTMRSSWLLAVP